MSDVLHRIVEEWSPAPLVVTRTIAPEPVRAFAGLLDQPDPLEVSKDLPPLWHWFHVTPTEPRSELGEDGHPREGHFLPPFPNRRRMMAGGRWTASRALQVGTTYERTSTLASITRKEGRSGEMLFVTIRHEFRDERGIAAVEEEDVVYRQQAPGEVRAIPGRSPARPDEPPAGLGVTIPTDPITLFRFSALTYNAHRIHYDQPYATGIEGYPGLVVHGPLLALAMLEIPRRFAADRPVAEFSYRLKAPLLVGTDIVAEAVETEFGWDLLVAGATSGTVVFAGG